jgi:23S rRNA pseudouridine2604 synthase
LEQKNQQSTNLNKFISSTGICSRREAEKLIIAGRVTINGNSTELGNRVFDGDVVKIDGRALQAKPKTLYIAFNKPVGIVCTTDSRERDNIIDYINHPERLFPIGRLDKPSEGLIFLTNDGDIVNKILRAGNNHEKDYVVKVDKPITDDFIKKMSNGIPILGTITKKCKVTKISTTTFQIVLTQGLNRQIRRMCEYVGYEVLKLQRTRIMNVQLDALKIGDWRELTEKELSEINTMVANSTKTEEASVDKQKPKKKAPKKTAIKPDAFTKKSAIFRKNSPKSKRNSNTSFKRKKR